MFSSNQVLNVSGSLSAKDELGEALKFGLKMAGATPDTKLVYQIANDGRYCIGCVIHVAPEEGWTEFPIGCNVDIIANLIRGYLSKFDTNEDIWDGSYIKGFLMENLPYTMSKEEYGIKNPFCCYLTFKPFTCFYSK